MSSFDQIINCGDSIVYGPFPNETLEWLAANKALSILGNTDKKVIKLLCGKSFKKPSNHEKRIMYTWTAEELNKSNSNYLRSLPKSATLYIPPSSVPAALNKAKTGIYHGTPAHHHEFLFENSPTSRFIELSEMTDCNIVVTGHSHSPYYKQIGKTHFINPGSVGRMFDGDPRLSCALLTITTSSLRVEHFRLSYDVEKVVSGIEYHQLPGIYSKMFILGKKLN